MRFNLETQNTANDKIAWYDQGLADARATANAAGYPRHSTINYQWPGQESVANMLAVSVKDAENYEFDPEFSLFRQYSDVPLNKAQVQRYSFWKYDPAAIEFDPQLQLEGQMVAIDAFSQLFTESFDFHFHYLMDLDNEYHRLRSLGPLGEFNDANVEECWHNLYHYWRNELYQAYIVSGQVTLPAGLLSGQWTIADILSELMDEMAPGGQLRDDLRLSAKGVAQAKTGASLGIMVDPAYQDSDGNTRFYHPRNHVSTQVVQHSTLPMEEGVITSFGDTSEMVPGFAGEHIRDVAGGSFTSSLSHEYPEVDWMAALPAAPLQFHSSTSRTSGNFVATSDLWSGDNPLRVMNDFSTIRSLPAPSLVYTSSKTQDSSLETYPGNAPEGGFSPNHRYDTGAALLVSDSSNAFFGLSQRNYWDSRRMVLLDGCAYWRGYGLNLFELIQLGRRISRALEAEVSHAVLPMMGELDSVAMLLYKPGGMTAKQQDKLYNVYASAFAFNENPIRTYTAAHMGPSNKVLPATGADALTLAGINLNTVPKGGNAAVTVRERYWTPQQLAPGEIQEIMDYYFPGVTLTDTLAGDISFTSTIAGDITLGTSGLLPADLVTRLLSTDSSMHTKVEKNVVLPAGVSSPEETYASGVGLGASQLIHEMLKCAFGSRPEFGLGHNGYIDIRGSGSPSINYQQAGQANIVPQSRALAVGADGESSISATTDDWLGRLHSHIVLTEAGMASEIPTEDMTAITSQGNLLLEEFASLTSGPGGKQNLLSSGQGNFEERDMSLATLSGDAPFVTTQVATANIGHGLLSWGLPIGDPAVDDSVFSNLMDNTGHSNGMTDSMVLFPIKATVRGNDNFNGPSLSVCNFTNQDSPTSNQIWGASGHVLSKSHRDQLCYMAYEDASSNIDYWPRVAVGGSPTVGYDVYSGLVLPHVAGQSPPLQKLFVPKASPLCFAKVAVVEAINAGDDLEWKYVLDGLPITESEAIAQGLTPDYAFTNVEIQMGVGLGNDARGHSAIRKFKHMFELRIAGPQGTLSANPVSTATTQILEDDLLEGSVEWTPIHGSPYNVSLQLSEVKSSAALAYIKSDSATGTWSENGAWDDEQGAAHDACTSEWVLPYKEGTVISQSYLYTMKDPLTRGARGGGQWTGVTMSGSITYDANFSQAVSIPDNHGSFTTASNFNAGNMNQFSHFPLTFEGVNGTSVHSASFEGFNQANGIPAAFKTPFNTYAAATPVVGGLEYAYLISDKPEHRMNYRPWRNIVDAAVFKEMKLLFIPTHERLDAMGGPLGLPAYGDAVPFRFEQLIDAGFENQFILEKPASKTRMVDSANRGMLTFSKVALLDEDTGRHMLSDPSREMNSMFLTDANTYSSSISGNPVYTREMLRDIQLGRQRQNWRV